MTNYFLKYLQYKAWKLTQFDSQEKKDKTQLNFVTDEPFRVQTTLSLTDRKAKRISYKRLTE